MTSTSSPSIVDALTEKIGGYEALPLLDTEYNHPEVQQMVLHMIQEEMKIFQPPKDNYLAALPYPKLKFSNAPGFAQEYERIKSSQGSSAGRESVGDTYAMKKQVDMSRYNVPGPKGALKEDAQAWRSAVINARVQLERVAAHGRPVNRALLIEQLQRIYPVLQEHAEDISHSISDTARAQHLVGKYGRE